MKRLVMCCLPVLVLLVLLSVGSAFAGSAQSSFTVTANVAANCSISSVGIAFNTYDPLSASNLDNTGSVTITCTKGTTATLELDMGQNSGLGPLGAGYRAMKSGTDTLSYNIYQDAGRNTLWSSGANSVTPPVAPSKAPRTYPTFGRVPAGQDVPNSTLYTDTVLATVNF